MGFVLYVHNESLLYLILPITASLATLSMLYQLRSVDWVTVRGLEVASICKMFVACFNVPTQNYPTNDEENTPPPPKKNTGRPESSRPPFDSVNITETVRSVAAILVNYIRRVVKQFTNGPLITSFRRTTPSP